jgi:predicted DNA-binding ribbon-helix-helix protein
MNLDRLVSDHFGGSARRSAAMRYPIVKFSVVIAGRRKIISLEEAFWGALKEIAAHRATGLLALIASIDSKRSRGNLSSTIRLFVLNFYREQLDMEDRREAIRVVLHNPISGLH